MNSLALSRLRYEWRNSFLDRDDTVAVTISGDVPRAIAAIRALKAAAIDVWIPPSHSAWEVRLAELPGVRRVCIAPVRSPADDGTAPSAPLPVYGRYREVVHLG